MIYFFINLCCLSILLNASQGFDHILDRSTVKDGDQFTISCNLKIANAGKDLPVTLQALVIYRMPSRTTLEKIFFCGSLIKETNTFGRPWILSNVTTCNPTEVDEISVDVTDAQCSDAHSYMCRAFYCTNEKCHIYVDETEELRRDGSCDEMNVNKPAGDRIDSPKSNSAHQETSPMLRQLVVGAIIIFYGMLAK